MARRQVNVVRRAGGDAAFVQVDISKAVAVEDWIILTVL